MPTEYQASMDWIWENRILDEQSTARWNLIYDQIIAGDGALNYIIRWQSYETLSYEQRQKMEVMISNQINAWTKWLIDFENWPYNQIDVNIVGWAVIDESVILDKHDDEVVYTTCTNDELYNSNSSIPKLLPYAPTENSRAEHFFEQDYVYPGTRFDMYLWGTSNFQGGAGGDWGQRVSDTYILSMLDSEDAHIIEHEIGHGFGMTDFYEDYQCPEWPEGSSNIMVAGWATQVTDYDGWMLRYIWNKIKDETNRFDIKDEPIETTITTLETSTETDETTSTTVTNNKDSSWSFDVSNATSVDIIVSGESYAGVAGTYTCLDINGNILAQDNWMMSNSLGESGTDLFNIILPANCSTVKVDVNYYAIWDTSIGDNKDLDISSLNITAKNMVGDNSLIGDLNNDKLVNFLDLLLLKKSLLGVSSPIDTTTYDINQDSNIDILDLLSLKEIILYN